MLGTFHKESYEYYAGWKGKGRKALKRSQVMKEGYIMMPGIGKHYEEPKHGNFLS